MPFAINRGIQIYYEVEGDGPPLVLHHGFTSSLEIWKLLGYTDQLKKYFKLIMLDSRGHGKSGKPLNVDAYSMSNRVRDIVTILDDLKIEKTHYFGYSMGGWIGFGMARHAIERVKSFVIGAAHPYPDHSWEHFRNITGEDQEGFIVALEAVLEEQISSEVRPLILDNNLEALVAAAQNRPSLESVLPQIKNPCMLFVGEGDSRCNAVRDCATQLDDVKFVSFPQLTHVDCFLRSDLVSPLVINFLLTPP